MLASLRLFLSDDVEDLVEAEEEEEEACLSAGGLALPFCLDVTLPV